jgi:NADH-quinone oxidoreductase subunit E
MLTATERQEIDAALAHAETPRAAASEALAIVQRHRGWIADDALADVAAALGLTVDELDALATAYSHIFRRPVGRHVILLCDSISCWVVGYERIRDHLAQRLGVAFGQTTPDGRFTLLPAACLGACDQAPAMMIDEDLHGRLDPDKIDRILEQYP